MPLRAFSILQIVSFLILMIVCRLFSIPVYVECAFLLAIPGLQLLFAGQHPDYFVRTDYRLVRVNRLAEQKTIVPDSVPRRFVLFESLLFAFYEQVYLRLSREHPRL